MSDDAQATPERWVCVGFRRFSDGTISQGWVAENGDPAKPRFWNDRRAYAVGAVYTLNITRTETDGLTVYQRQGDPRYTGDTLPAGDERVPVWEIESERALRRKRMDAAERKVKANKRLDAALAPLLDVARPMSFDQRDALVTYVRRALYRLEG